MSLRFRQLQAFHAIVELGTVTAAAEYLGISQPGVSNLLHQLERQTRVTLFRRDKGRLVPTPEARLLYREVDTVVRGLDHVAQAVTDLQNKQAGHLQVASQHSMSFGFMPRLIAGFARDRPDLTISFQSQYSSKIQEWVLSGLFEIGICERPVLHDGLQVRSFELTCRLALPADHPLAAEDVVTPEMLRDAPFVAMGPEHMTHRRTRDAYEAAGLTWRPRIHTHLFKNVLSFVREGMGVAILDPFALEFETGPEIVSRPFLPEIAMDMAVITSRNRPLSDVGGEFLAVLLEAIAPYSRAGLGGE